MTARRRMDRLAEGLIAIEQGLRRRHPDFPEYALVLLSGAHEGQYRGSFQASDAASCNLGRSVWLPRQHHLPFEKP